VPHRLIKQQPCCFIFTNPAGGATKETSFVYQGKRGFSKHASSVVFLTFLCNCREIATLEQVGILTYKFVKYQQQVKKVTR
jgi:hypothetical protein